METTKKTDTYSMRVIPELVDALKIVAAKYPNKNDFAKDIVSRLSSDESEKDNEIASLKQQIAQLNSNSDTFADISKDNVIVPVTPFRRECLNYLIERERTNNGIGEELNEATFYNYVLDVMLIEGNKFSFKSVPNSVIRQINEKLGRE